MEGVLGALARLSPASEKKFRQWFDQWASKSSIDPNPDAPEHFYDYRGAFVAGAEPERDKLDDLYHWPSEFKAPDHPNRFVVIDGALIDTITGKPVLR